MGTLHTHIKQIHIIKNDYLMEVLVPCIGLRLIFHVLIGKKKNVPVYLLVYIAKVTYCKI